MKNLKDVPDDPDTTIINQQEVVVNNLPALHQQWSWEGIVAESVIFHADDVEHLEDAALFEMVRIHCNIDPDKRYTIKRSSSGYTFVNFNFEYSEDLLFKGKNDKM